MTVIRSSPLHLRESGMGQCGDNGPTDDPEDSSLQLLEQLAAYLQQLLAQLENLLAPPDDSGDDPGVGSGTPGGSSPPWSGVQPIPYPPPPDGSSPPWSGVQPIPYPGPPTDPSSGAPFAGDSGGAHGGYNTVPNRIDSPQAAANLVGQVRNAGGSTLRIQMSHDEIDNPSDMAKLDALVKAGNQQGVKIQFTFRDNDNGGGGNVMRGDQLQQAANDVRKVVGKYGNDPSFVLDTFNEGGKSATQDWADMQSTLIKAARDTGYKGKIIVEDSNWGGGLTAGGESGLVKYKGQLAAANGAGNPALEGSIHEYSNGSDASSRLSQEIKALEAAGYKPQIGEVGNANWTGGNNFEERDGAVQAVKDNMGLLREASADVLPWPDQFGKDGKMTRTAGLKPSEQLV